MNINNEKISEELTKRLLENDSTLQGFITLDINIYKTNKNDGVITIIHNLYSPNNIEYMSEIDDYLRSNFPKYTYIFHSPGDGLKVNTVNSNFKKATKIKNREKNEVSPDAVQILYYGYAATNSVVIEDDYKKSNPNIINKLSNIIEVLEFIAPVVVDENWRVIDGASRVRIARKLNIHKIPVVMIKVDEVKKDFLRIALNRTSEFQKWYYNDSTDVNGEHKGLDNFVDDNPQLQPLLEPIGVFGERILPVSFFNSSILRYRVEDYNVVANQYKQEIGLAKWAELQSERIKEAEERKKKLNEGYIKDKTQLTSLFDLTPSDNDFLPTHDIKKIRSDFVEETKKDAAKLTKKADSEARKRKEALGQEWQSSRLTASEKKEQRRLENLKKNKNKEDDNIIINDDATAVEGDPITDDKTGQEVG